MPRVPKWLLYISNILIWADTQGYTLFCWTFPLLSANFVCAFIFSISKASCCFVDFWSIEDCYFYLSVISRSWNSNDLQTASYCPVPRKSGWASCSGSEWLKFPYFLFIYTLGWKLKQELEREGKKIISTTEK